MRVLGVHGTSNYLFFAAAEDDAIVPGLPTRVEVPNDLKLTTNIVALRTQVDMVLGEIKPDNIIILIAGAPDRSYQRATARVGAETILRVVAIDRQISCAFLTRQRCRSKLTLAAGDLGTSIDKGLERVDPYWSNRKFAIAAALAGLA